MKSLMTICIAMLAGLVAFTMNASAQTYTVGDTVCFTVAAVDMNGDTLRDWDQTGVFCNLTLEHSTANSDTSAQSWSANPDAYTWAKVLHNGVELSYIPPSTWTLPNFIFDDGKVELCLVHTKADTGVRFTLCPGMVVVQTNAGPIHFKADTVDNFLVEITSSTSQPDQVYLMRKYEFFVIPRDRFLNVSNEQVKAYFFARYQGEFYNGQGAPNLFSGAVFISGPTNYFAASTVPHGKPDGQWIKVVSDDLRAEGQSNNYEILDHAPKPFELVTPLDREIVNIVQLSTERDFTWDRSQDPYTNIPISRVTPEVGNDVVSYTVHFLDSASLTKQVDVESDQDGIANTYSTNHVELLSIGERLLGDRILYPLLWYVDATDGLYLTPNNSPDTTRPLPGRYLTLLVVGSGDAVTQLPSSPTSTALHQNYPNPVAPGGVTNIRFSVMEYGPVSLVVYDMLGNRVATVANSTLAPGVYTADFTATNLPPGVYHYTLTSGMTVITKSMVVTK